MYKGKDVSVVIAAAGMGKRLGAKLPKQYLKIGGVPILVKTLLAFDKMKEVDRIVIVANKDYRDYCHELVEDGGITKVKQIVDGGEQRQDSVYNALKAVQRMSSEAGIVLIHDGARPYINEDVILNVIKATASDGAAVACVSMKDSLRRLGGNGHAKGSFAGNPSKARHPESRAVDRNEYVAVQTPQGFIIADILNAYERAMEAGYYGTDDASVAEYCGINIKLVDGDYANIKITTKEDLPMENRVGTGFDVHKFEEGRRLILGGVDIEYEKGLAGHSDADVLVHAIMDALLGAAALGDIGRHFPDTDMKYKGISSLKLLEHVGTLLNETGYSIANIDATVIAQAPKIAPYISEMTKNIAETLMLDMSRINIKGTTTERLGFTGRKEGIAAEAVCSIYK